MADLKESVSALRRFLKKQRGERYETPEGLAFTNACRGMVLMYVPVEGNPESNYFIASQNLASLKEFAKKHGFVFAVNRKGCPVVGEVSKR